MIFPVIVNFATLISTQEIEAVSTEVVTPFHLDSFNNGGRAKQRVQPGNPTTVQGHLVFDGAGDGNRQVDPQIAVGGGYVLNGTNGGLLLYDKKGNYVDGVSQEVFKGGIDPKLFFDPNNRVFGFDFWKYYDKPKLKPVNISVSETADPKGAWNTYSISETKEVDGGAIGYSKNWIGYSFPGGPNQVFVMKMADVKAGKPATVYHFAGNFGQPVFNQDNDGDLYFLALRKDHVIITAVGKGKNGDPVVKSQVTAPHIFEYFDYPPGSPMKGTDKLTASGDRNPKDVVLQSGKLWFSQTVNVDGRAAVAWHEITLEGRFIQSGLISDPVNSYIETSLGVNRHGDVLVGFQETGPDMDISPRCAWRRAGDKAGTLSAIFSFGTGKGPTEGGAWGDYSGTVVDGDNLTDLWTIQSEATVDGRGATKILKWHPRG